MEETPVGFLGQEIPLEKGQATHSSILGLPQWVRICLQCGRPGFNSWVGKIPCRRAWHPTPLFLPGESPWTEKPGGLLSMESQRLGHNSVTKHTHRARLRIKGETKNILDKQKLKEFTTVDQTYKKKVKGTSSIWNEIAVLNYNKIYENKILPGKSK